MIKPTMSSPAIVLDAARWKLIVALFFSIMAVVLFVPFPILLAIGGEPELLDDLSSKHIFGVLAGSIVFGSMSISLAKRVKYAKGLITISDEGILFRAFEMGVIPWEDVVSVHAWRDYVGLSGRRYFIHVTILNNEEWRARIWGRAQRFYPSSWQLIVRHSLFALDINGKELERIINNRP